MRTLSLTLILSLLAVPAMAQLSSAAAVNGKPAASTPNAATSATPAIANTSSSEPNMKVTLGSGGKSTASIIKDAPVKGDYVDGKSDAPVTIIEYASMSCPHCAHFANTVLPVIQKKYIDTGKVNYILRQFPLNEPALKGADLLECVGEQSSDRYYTFAKVLFDAQDKWAFDGNYMSGLETIAGVGGLSKEQFQSCVNNTDREMRVLKEKQLAEEQLQLPHTPYIFIGGEVYEGDRTPEAVSQFIETKIK